MFDQRAVSPWKLVFACCLLSWIALILILTQVDLDEYDDAPPNSTIGCLTQQHTPTHNPPMIELVLALRFVFAGVRSAVPIYSAHEPAPVPGTLFPLLAPHPRALCLRINP